jgi:hypothetical protein
VSEAGWGDFHRRWSRLKPPLRANAEVIAAISAVVKDQPGCVLLLGVTPELADIGRKTVAVDWSENMIAHVWPGDTDRRRAVLGDWLAMPLRRRRFSAVIGDGSLNCLAYGDYPALFARLERLLAPGARLAVRVYATPAPCESIDSIRQDAMAGRIAGFHAFKWRLAMAIAAERRSPDVPVALIHRLFENQFADRRALGRAAGWDREEIDEIDAYACSETAYSFPTLGEFAAALPRSFRQPRFVDSGAYELAERCPILVAEFRA